MLQYFLVKKAITINIYGKSTLSHFRMNLSYQFDDLPEVQDGFSQAFVLANLILGYEKSKFLYLLHYYYLKKQN
jgi:hypothetical protein